jgi:long-chain acyl-CoA synthetase
LFIVEFLIADLALATLSITSITVSSADILSSCIKLYPEAAVITDAKILPQIFTIIGDRRIIVIGEHYYSRAENILQWTEIEKAGTGAAFTPPPLPS